MGPVAGKYTGELDRSINESDPCFPVSPHRPDQVSSDAWRDSCRPRALHTPPPGEFPHRFTHRSSGPEFVKFFGLISVDLK